VRQAFNGHDLAAVRLWPPGRCTKAPAAVDQHGAGAAFGFIAADLGAGQAQAAAQQIDSISPGAHHIAVARHPGRQVEDRQGHTLRAHDPVEGRSLIRAAQRQVETDQQLALGVQGRLTRPTEQGENRRAAQALRAGDLDLGVHRHQRDHTVGSRQGMRHIAAQRGRIAHLGTANQAARFRYRVGMLDHQR
jgi:hypothetical protein